MSSTILLDFDGVVIDNNHINKYITHKSIQFIQKKYHKGYKKATVLNKQLYSSCGHTAIGIDSDNYKQNVLDYNEYVFSNINYDEIRNLLVHADLIHMKKLCNYSFKFGLFTNAPIEWCENILMLANVDLYEVMDGDLCFSSNEGLVKPKKESYKNVESKLYNVDKIHFIDDNKMNFKEIIENEKWSTHWLNTSRYINLHTYLDRNLY
jgi:FMN phosphatase YigB (HAD superfamily)